MLVFKGRSSFCEASHDFELKTLSFLFLCAEVSLGSFAFEVGYLDADGDSLPRKEGEGLLGHGLAGLLKIGS